jgi:hypothetical protein
MYTFSSKLKLCLSSHGRWSFSIGYGFNCTKDIQEVEEF